MDLQVVLLQCQNYGKALEDELLKHGPEVLYERLRQQDPQYANSDEIG